ncbi:MAG: hypothetical protein SPLM_09290 [Spiroplasma phoeniceum]|uniref:PQQ-binding-like beta-propeller repeat protein n=1 Tax=Spiroplasma phoeniceum TaxID=47835 RepID=UPI00313406B5
MKKLLSLLSVLTISVSAVPTTIAANPYQKKENNKKDIVGISEIVIKTSGRVYSSGVVLNNKLYIGSFDEDVYEYDPATKKSKVVIRTDGEVHSSGVVLNNKLYIGSDDEDVYEYDPATKTSKVVIETDGKVRSSGVVLNNKLYIGSWDGNVYEYDPATKTSKVVIRTRRKINSSGVILNNKLYIGSWDRNVYEYDPLELIEFNYIINMKEQVKKGLYLYYKKQNPNSEVKKIYNINLENLTVSDVIIEQTQKYKSSNLEQNFESVCKDSVSLFKNYSSIEQTQYTISCSKELTETNTFQKMNGFTKSETTSNTDNWSTNVNTKVTAKASSSASIPNFINGKIEVDIKIDDINIQKAWGESKTYTISDMSNSADTKIKTTTNTITINVPSQPIKIQPHSSISVSTNTWKNNIELNLNVFQKVEGLVSAKIIDKNNNEEIVNTSIKNAMFSLLERNILPLKIKINDDNSINFSYDIKSKKEIIVHQTEIEEFIPLN